MGSSRYRYSNFYIGKKFHDNLFYIHRCDKTDKTPQRKPRSSSMIRSVANHIIDTVSPVLTTDKTNSTDKKSSLKNALFSKHSISKCARNRIIGFKQFLLDQCNLLLRNKNQTKLVMSSFV